MARTLYDKLWDEHQVAPSRRRLLPVAVPLRPGDAGESPTVVEVFDENALLGLGGGLLHLL